MREVPVMRAMPEKMEMERRRKQDKFVDGLGWAPERCVVRRPGGGTGGDAEMKD